jgi:hypothetical protein
MVSMVDEGQDDLQPVLMQLAEVRRSYQRFTRVGAKGCQDEFDALLAWLGSRSVSAILDKRLADAGRVTSLSKEREKELINTETRLAKQFGYQPRQVARRAAKAAQMMRSADADSRSSRAIKNHVDLETFLRGAHTQALRDLVEKPGFSARRRRQNREAVARIDIALYAAWSLIVDALEMSAMSFSYEIGAIYAKESGPDDHTS